MKPCLNNRESIALLALGMLDASRERDLRAHLQTCAPCHAYSKEIFRLTEKLANVDVRSDITATERFHQKLVGRLKAPNPASFALIEQLRGVMSNWRVAVAAGACAIVVAALVFLPRNPNVPTPVASATLVVAPKPKADIEPTIFNYQMTANHSIEALDELLTRQGNKNFPPAPVYSASTRSRADALE
jgi:anti-sigma factor RsiW